MEKYLDATGLKTYTSIIKEQIGKGCQAVLDTKAQPDGIASLDSSGNVPLSQLGNVDNTLYEIVTALPSNLAATSTLHNRENHIFILARAAADGTSQNAYKEYIYTGPLDAKGNVQDITKWEELGEFTSDVDLKGYSKKVETIAAVEIIETSSGTNTNAATVRLTLADGTQKTVSIPTAAKSGSTYLNGLMLGSDKEKLDKIDVDALLASINNANTAAATANTAADNANKAADNATAAAKTATTNADNATAKANTAATNADTATSKANTATTNAETATAAAKEATDNADTATAAAKEATTNAETATTNAQTAADNAKEATDKVLDTLGIIVPTGLEVEEYPSRLTFGNMQDHYIKAKLSPDTAMQNLIYMSDNKAVEVALDGRITVTNKGVSRVYVIPTCNTALARTLLIEVVGPPLRLVTTRQQMRFTQSGGLRFN